MDGVAQNGHLDVVEWLTLTEVKAGPPVQWMKQIRIDSGMWWIGLLGIGVKAVLPPPWLPVRLKVTSKEFNGAITLDPLHVALRQSRVLCMAITKSRGFSVRPAMEPV
ncbi:hypothetical protein JG687_00016279 [Phytophthora cactorum]|uniref:Uncharacterized protein n=1 Tax=Phytophthora cactorum TaxID=29920 RepID=A0A8T1JVD1_9STRA|nr:hypothetical protein PC116_g25721 [Phytophthora cactorum]KAG6947174.1 hypothetical protein JG687_00016279 [Phytophthora cactorum]